ncbi:MAG: hypothetical protein R3E48_12900 [Burkholderiaceae bacterium]
MSFTASAISSISGEHDQRERGDQQVGDALGDTDRSVERRFAHGHDRNAAHRIDSRLDEIVEEDVRHEVDRGGRVPKIIEQLEDARLRGHRQRDVDLMHAVGAHEVRHLADSTRQWCFGHFAESIGHAVVEKGDHSRGAELVAIERARKPAAGLVGADHHRDLARLQRHHLWNQVGRAPVDQEQRERRQEHP